ncbi:MAG: NAD(P)H-hydrate dehydratase [Lachnospiraceae bacterium]|nr:NAD(P)H-hydrate dehydratase [Lachnospiraceae bacterium]
MQYLLNAKEMKQADTNTIEHFRVPSLVLMERAALKVVEVIEEERLNTGHTLIVCGCGNNGGDGLAVARMLRQKGAEVTVCLLGDYEKCSPQTKQQYDILIAYGVEIQKEIPEREYTLVIDAIFGIGLSRDVEGNYRDAILKMNEISADKLAVDIPSGIHSDSGRIMGCSFFAEHTVTFAYNKLGLNLYPGAEAAGKITVAEIGITEESFLGKEPQTIAFTEEDLTGLPKRQAESNKGTYGKVLVIAGNEQMAGAAYFSAKAAYLCGCGLVKVVTHENNKTMLHTKLPEALIQTYEGKKAEKESLIEAVNWADVIVVGPGLGQSPLSENILKTVLKTASVPMVLDADALNLLAKERELLKLPHTDLIVTPHLGEMARLADMPVDYIKKNLILTAEEFAREYNVICVLKDARTIISIPYGKTYVNLSGNHGMATGGSGDVLTGMIAGLLAGGVSPETAAALGVYLHGKAGDTAAGKAGHYSLMASDILDGISEVTK